MPIITYFFVAGTALLALLFYADAKMEPRGPLSVNTEFAGLPKPWQPPRQVPSLAVAPAPAPDMHSAAVLAAEPEKAKPVAVAASTEKAEPPKKKKHIARRAPREDDDGPRYAWRNGGDSPFGLPFFGRF